MFKNGEKNITFRPRSSFGDHKHPEINREDSGDYNDSIGDQPIELPHLEGELGGDHQRLWSSFVLERRRHDPNFTLNGKSKSLDDLMQQSTEEKKSTSKDQMLHKRGRAYTMEDQV